MPIIIHDYLGKGHDLSKGAFDSQSISKPGAASKYLEMFLPQKFKEGWKELSFDYRTALKSYQPSMWKKMWANFGTKGLLSIFQHGAAKYSVGRPLIHQWIASVAKSDPTIGAVVAAAEVGLAKVLETWGDKAGTKTIRAKKGQWIFIESEESHRLRRRMYGSVEEDMDPQSMELVHKPFHYKGQNAKEKTKKFEQPPKQPVKKTVSLGFFIEPTTKNRVNVFCLDLGRALEIEVSQLLECDPAVAQRLDSDERLSALRELYFYKYDGQAPFKKDIQTEPFFPGKSVRYQGSDFIFIHEQNGQALLEDTNGKTLVVATVALERGFGDSTPGEYNNQFVTNGKNSLTVGLWIFVPSRPLVRSRYDNEFELAVINHIAPAKQCLVYYAIDGEIAYVNDSDIEIINKKFQEVYNSNSSFMLFKSAAVKGSGVRRWAMGQDNIQVCIGFDHSDALTTTKPFEEQLDESSIYEDFKKQGGEVGNNKKVLVDVKDELRAKGLKLQEINPSSLKYVTPSNNVTGTVIVGLAIAAVAFALYAA